MRKIIHVDMDCFFAAIEMRDNPKLRQVPLAVGGSANKRGVLCTCNYLARQYGLHSAMSTAYALTLCPDLVVVPPHIEKYKVESQHIRQIFSRYTEDIEPLSLDEAYLDVTGNSACQGSGTLIAKEIRQSIFQETGLSASAGIAPNKFLAKVASDWQKPNGQFVLPPQQIEAFLRTLSVGKICGVGKVTLKKLLSMGVENCGQLQEIPFDILKQRFGVFGERLYNLCRGLDQRPVSNSRQRKSLSVEETYDHDLTSLSTCLQKLPELMQRLQDRYHSKHALPIKGQFLKLKFSDFTLVTTENLSNQLSGEIFKHLCQKAYARKEKAVRLIGLGLRFQNDKHQMVQLELGF